MCIFQPFYSNIFSCSVARYLRADIWAQTLVRTTLAREMFLFFSFSIDGKKMFAYVFKDLI
jgi:hypothetical protein